MVSINDTDRENAEVLLRAFINENFPSIETRKGSVFRSLVISPAASFYALMQAEIKELKDSQSLLSLDSATDSSVLEEILSNFLLTKNTGSNSTGILRLDVSVDKIYVVSANSTFITSEDISYINTIDYTFSKDSELGSGKGNLFYDSDKKLHYFLLPVESLLPSEVLVEQDEVFTIDPLSFIDSSLVSIVANSDFSKGRLEETISEFKDRVEESITVRNLVTKKSINTVLKENFPGILSVHTVGYGDIEMLRDLILPQGIHKGGTVDVYCRTEYLPQTISYEKSIITNLEVELTSPETPIFKVDKVELSSGNLLETLVEGTDYTITFSHSTSGTESYTLNTLVSTYSRFSSKEVCKIKFLKASYDGSRVVVTVTKPSTVSSIQDFVNLKDNRVICADLCVKAFAPVFIKADIKYRLKEGSTAPTDSEITTVLQGYINSLTGLDTIEVSEVVCKLLEFESIAGVVLPLSLTASVYKPDGTVTSISFSDKLTIPEEKAIGFSQNICQYILISKDITLESV